MKKILITGATGFLGKNLTKLFLKKKYRCCFIVRSKKSFLFKNEKCITSSIENINNNNLKKIISFKPEVLVHLAWHGIPDFSAKNSFNNLQQQVLFFNQILKIKTLNKIIITGSCWENLKFSMLNSNIKYFVLVKNFVRFFLIKILKKTNKKLIWLKIFYMYGPGQKKTSLIPTILSALRKNKEPKIINFKSKQDFIYVEDVCNSIVNCIDKINTNLTLNVRTRKLTSVNKIFNLCLKNYRILKTKYNKKNINLSNYKELLKIQKHEKIHSTTSLNEGILKTIVSNKN